MNVSRRKKILIPLIIILFPVCFWLIISSGHNKFRHLQIYGPVELNAAGDSIYHTIGNFHFKNQENKIVSLDDLEGKIFVANFFFASCPSVCPEMNAQVLRVQKKFSTNNDVRFLSFTVDPENDSVPVLADYAAKLGVAGNQWWFMTGNQDSIYALARESFLVPVAEGETAKDFIHTQDLILIDKEKRIRGIYDGLEKREVDTLMDEIQVLLHEYTEK